MVLHSTVSVQGSFVHCCEHGTESLVLIEGGEFTDKLGGCQSLTKGAAAVKHVMTV
jgi:hypothetical protein